MTPRPGVLDCGCLWDGKILSVQEDCDLEDHGLADGTVYIRHGRSEPIPNEWPTANGDWFWAQRKRRRR